MYQVVLLAVGSLLFGPRLNSGSIVALGLMLFAFSLCAVSIVLVAGATFRTVNQVPALVNVGAMVFGGIGGALVPLEQLPGWAQAIAPGQTRPKSSSRKPTIPAGYWPTRAATLR
jgi:ABC-2 type transport system permease protein